MNEDHLPSLSESEKEAIQKEATMYTITVNATPTGDRYCGFIAGASLQLRRAKKREADAQSKIAQLYTDVELFEAFQAGIAQCNAFEHGYYADDFRTFKAKLRSQ